MQLALLLAAGSAVPRPLSRQTLEAQADGQLAAFRAEIAKLRAANGALLRDNRALKGMPTGQVAAAGTERTEEACVISDFLPIEEHVHIADVGVPFTGRIKDSSDFVDTALRLQQMDDSGVTRMVISQMQPGVQLLPSSSIKNASAVAHALNLGLLDFVGVSGARWKALCNIFMGNVTAAIEELGWCQEQGFPGVMLHGYEIVTNADGSLSLDFFYKETTMAFWRQCAARGMFVYMHPQFLPVPPDGLYDSSVHKMPDGQLVNITRYADQSDAESLKTVFFTDRPWGFSLLVAQVVASMILHDVFTEVPDLQMVIGHMGEMIMFHLWRIDKLDTSASASWTKLFLTNFYVTTSGFFDTAALVHLLSLMPHDRILFAADSPYESMEDATKWFRNISLSNPEIPCETLNAIAYKNAESLLSWGRRSED